MPQRLDSLFPLRALYGLEGIEGLVFESDANVKTFISKQRETRYENNNVSYPGIFLLVDCVRSILVMDVRIVG